MRPEATPYGLRVMCAGCFQTAIGPPVTWVFWKIASGGAWLCAKCHENQPCRNRGGRGK